jgi:hypothetical protein
LGGAAHEAAQLRKPNPGNPTQETPTQETMLSHAESSPGSRGPFVQSTFPSIPTKRRAFFGLYRYKSIQHIKRGHGNFRYTPAVFRIIANYSAYFCALGIGGTKFAVCTFG